MKDIYDLNRLEYMILESLYDSGSLDRFHGMSITDLMDYNEGTIGVRMTVYRKMKKLLANGYIAKGALDNHADTFYLLDKGFELFDGGGEE